MKMWFYNARKHKIPMSRMEVLLLSQNMRVSESKVLYLVTIRTNSEEVSCNHLLTRKTTRYHVQNFCSTDLVSKVPGWLIDKLKLKDVNRS
jgi:hypothetical protein